MYADLSVPRDESGPLATLEDETTEEIGGGTYGALKALCERVVTEAFGERAAIVRPGFVIGPYDHTGRFPWWAHRAARGGEMIVPASLARAFQAIDTRDLADFLLLRARSPLTGVFNATGPVPPVTMLDLVEAAASASDTDLNVEVVDDAFLTEQGIESELPLWADDPLWAAWARVDVAQGDRRRAALPADRRHRRGDARPHRGRAGARARAGARGGAARRLARAADSTPGSGEQRLLEQEGVQRDDHDRHHDGGDGRRAAVDEPAHQRAVAAEHDERDERERDPERQHDLAQDQRLRRG